MLGIKCGKWGIFGSKINTLKFSLNHLIYFSQVVLNNKYLKENKREGLGFLKNNFIIPKKKGK